ncbi:MAG: DUF2802 domain-containing protein [Bdellovibrionales bacterium]|nr:DUF2802 domain-containing protein [Bdellovibrionales bacterium]
MTLWMVIQIVFNIFISLAVYVFWVKLRKPPKDDPRLSRGLQLLQSKISVLEDLSDKTELQVEQLNALMEKRIKQVQVTLEEADSKLRKIEESIHRNKEVAKIFQDQVPHDEIVKRQNTIKYIKAAKMANSGSTVEEIAEEIDLPISEIELIAKLNKDNLVFDDDSLPEWAKEEGSSFKEDDWQMADKDFKTPDLSSALTYEPQKYDSLQKLGDEFRRACSDYDAQQEVLEAPSQLVEATKAVKNKVADIGGELAESIAQTMQKSMDKIQENLNKNPKEENIQDIKTVEPKEEQTLNESDATSPTIELEASEVAIKEEVREEVKEPINKKEPSLTLEEVSEIDSSAKALEKMQKNRRLVLSQPENQGIKKVEFPKTSIDINKTLG